MFEGIKLRRDERRKEVERNLSVEVGKLDPDLAVQCAYYPRPRYWRDEGWIYPCEDCSFSSPNLSCKRAHLLEDTRTDVVVALKLLIRRKDKEIEKLQKIVLKKEVR